MSKVKIFLADLFYAKASTRNVVPLNLGYMASALEASLGDAVECEIFKYPEMLIAKMKKERPHVLALANYCWNLQLQLRFARLAKEWFQPAPFVVMGGPNIRYQPQGVKEFLDRHKEVDVYIPLEAETAFCHLIENLVNHESCVDVRDYYARHGEVNGCYLNVDGYRFAYLDEKLSTPNLSYGSPYLKGLLDEFIRDPAFIPVFETNRGCPYSCTFCAWGVSVLTKMKKRDFDMVMEELRYVAKNGVEQQWWYFADANFGIFERDLDFAKEIRRLKDTFGSPHRLDINWAKNPSAERMVEIVKAIKDMRPGQIAVQSFDEGVLQRIKRVNIKEEEMRRLIRTYHDLGYTVFTDILVGCSGESLELHYKTLRKAFESGFDEMNIGNIRMLPGTEMESEADRQKYGFVTKFRLVPDSCGFYDGEFVYEIEEGIRASDSITEEEINGLKITHFLIYLLWNSGYAKNVLKACLRYGINPLDILLDLQSNANCSRGYKRVLEELYREASEEWFDSEDALRKHYSNPAVYEKFKKEIPLKLNWKYFAIFLSSRELLEGIIEDTCQLAAHKMNLDSELTDVIKEIILDGMKLNYESLELEKTRRYYASEKTYLFLKNHQMIPEGVPFCSGGFELGYVYNEERYKDLMEILKRYNHREYPLPAITAALVNGMSTSFVYKMAAPSPLSSPAL